MKYLETDGSINNCETIAPPDTYPDVYLDDNLNLSLIQFKAGYLDPDEVLQIEFYYDSSNKLESLVVDGAEFKFKNHKEDKHG